jgi:hypothetical protein
MPDENTVRIDSSEAEDGGDATPEVVEVETGPLTRRAVLGTAASALAGGSLLATVADEAAAAPHDGGELDVRTTDVEILDDEEHRDGDEESEIRTKGRVSGMSNYDCERCEVGAQVRPLGGNRWYGGLQTVEHTHRDSFRVGVTLAGLHPGKYECRLCACPITHTNVFFANVLLIVVKRAKEGKKKKYKGKKKKKNDEKKLKKAYRKTCPCKLTHSRKYHLMVCGGSPSNVCEYAFRATTSDITRVGVSNAPNVVASRHVTATDTEDYIDGDVVTGAVAGGGDSYVCRGGITDVRVDTGAYVYVNGMDVTDAVSRY